MGKRDGSFTHIGLHFLFHFYAENDFVEGETLEYPKPVSFPITMNKQILHYEYCMEIINNIREKGY